MLRAIPTLLATALATSLAIPAGARGPAPQGRPPVLAPQVFDDLQRLDVNSISMVVKNTGSFAYDTQNGAAGLEFPKGSGKTACSPAACGWERW